MSAAVCSPHRLWEVCELCRRGGISGEDGFLAAAWQS